MKKQKIFKALGVGALCLCGALTFVGCSNVEIGKDQVNSTVEAVQEINDALKLQNELLLQQNEELKKQNEEIKDLNKLTKEDVWNIVSKAELDARFNIGGVRNNLKINDYENDVLESEYMYLTTDSVMYYVESYIDGDDISWEICYDTEDGMISATVEKTIGGYQCVEFSLKASSSVSRYLSNYLGTEDGPLSRGFTIDDIVNYSVNENGNIQIDFIEEWENSTGTQIEEVLHYSYLYSAEGKLLKESETRATKTNNTWELSYEVQDMLYGEVDEEFVNFLKSIVEEERAKQ